MAINKFTDLEITRILPVRLPTWRHCHCSMWTLGLKGHHQRWRPLWSRLLVLFHFAGQRIQKDKFYHCIQCHTHIRRNYISFSTSLLLIQTSLPSQPECHPSALMPILSQPSGLDLLPSGTRPQNHFDLRFKRFLRSRYNPYPPSTFICPSQTNTIHHSRW